MQKSSVGESRSHRRLAASAGLALLAGAGGVLATELRHRRELERDTDRELLQNPLRGTPLNIASDDGAWLHAEAFGPQNAPTVVLVPGWTEQLRIFDLLTRGLLGRGFRVVAYDLRGQGRSDRKPGLDQSIERYGEDLGAVLAATCGDRNDVIVAGHSLGGMSILAWAGIADVARRARAVALISTAASTLVDAPTLLPATIPQGARRQIANLLLARDAPLLPVSTPASRALTRYLMFGPAPSPAQVEFVEQMIWTMRPRLRASAGATLRRLDLTSSLERVTVPTLVVVGDLDRLTPPVQAERMVASLPHVIEFLHLADCGHAVPLERPNELGDALARLAAGVGLASGEATDVAGAQALP
jgi:pimeloyl-ACP methyl ester carboxylesterase